jgi:hypothetical protein
MRKTILIIVSLTASLSTEVAAVPAFSSQDGFALINGGRMRDRPSTRPISQLQHTDLPSKSTVTVPSQPNKDQNVKVPVDDHKSDRPRPGGHPNHDGVGTPHHDDVHHGEREDSPHGVKAVDRHLGGPPHGLFPPWIGSPPPPTVSVTPSPSFDDPVGIPIDAYVPGLPIKGPSIENGRIIEERDLGPLGVKLHGVIEKAMADLKEKIEDLLTEAKLNDILAKITGILAAAKSGDIMSKIPDLIANIKDMFSGDKVDKIKLNIEEALSKHELTEVKAWAENMREKVESRNSDLVQHLKDIVESLRGGLGGAEKKRQLTKRFTKEVSEMLLAILRKHPEAAASFRKALEHSDAAHNLPKFDIQAPADSETLQTSSNVVELEHIIKSGYSPSVATPEEFVEDAMTKVYGKNADVKVEQFNKREVDPSVENAPGHFNDVFDSFREKFKTKNPQAVAAKKGKLKSKADKILQTFTTIKSSLHAKLASSKSNEDVNPEGKLAEKIRAAIEHITNIVQAFKQKFHGAVAKGMNDLKPNLKAKVEEAISGIVNKIQV